MIKTVTKRSVAEVLQAKPRSMERRAMKYGGSKDAKYGIKSREVQEREVRSTRALKYC
jgi:hypothetical protein